MDDLFKSLAAEIRAARKRAGMTQEQLAAELGVTPDSVSQFERGVIRPSVETIATMAKTLPADFGKVFAGPASDSKRSKLEDEMMGKLKDLNDREITTLIRIADVLRETRK